MTDDSKLSRGQAIKRAAHELPEAHAAWIARVNQGGQAKVAKVA